MMNIETEVMSRIHSKYRDTGIKPTHLIVDRDTWYKMYKSFNSIEGKLVPAEYSKEGKWDTFLGLIISILSNNSVDAEYMEVV